MCTSSVEDGDVNLTRPASPDMLREDADQPARCRQSFVEEIRGNSLNRIPQVQKLRFSLSGHRTSDTSELVHRSAADLALDDRDYGPLTHRKFEGHERSFSNDIVQKWALLLKVKLNRHLSSDPQSPPWTCSLSRPLASTCSTPTS